MPWSRGGFSLPAIPAASCYSPWALTLLAEAHARLGNPVEGLGDAADAALVMAKTDERFCEAELHRVRGELLDETGDQAGAEQNYQKALAAARRQSARIFELRAATSLARLWRARGKCARQRSPRTDLQLVQRRCRDAGSARREGIARGAGGMIALPMHTSQS